MLKTLVAALIPATASGWRRARAAANASSVSGVGGTPSLSAWLGSASVREEHVAVVILQSGRSACPGVVFLPM